jgi:hypothetical protein
MAVFYSLSFTGSMLDPILLLFLTVPMDPTEVPGWYPHPFFSEGGMALTARISEKG